MFNLNKIIILNFLVVGFCSCYGSAYVTPDQIRTNLTMQIKQIDNSPPQNFPDSSVNNSAVHFYKNSTIEQQLLLHNQVMESNAAPLRFPEHNSNNTVFKTNETILRKLLHETTTTTQASQTTPRQSLSTRLLPPVTFPTDADKYKIITNKAQEEKFLAVAKNIKATKVDTEVTDLLSKKTYDGKFDTDQINPLYIPKNTSQEIVMAPKTPHHTQTAEKELAHGPMAGLLIGVLLTIAIFGYITLVLWRRALEYKYGNRERLVNEEDFDPHYDSRFEL